MYPSLPPPLSENLQLASLFREAPGGVEAVGGEEGAREEDDPATQQLVSDVQHLERVRAEYRIVFHTTDR